MTEVAASRHRRLDARLALPAAVAWVVAIVLIGIPPSSVGGVAGAVAGVCAAAGGGAAIWEHCRRRRAGADPNAGADPGADAARARWPGALAPALLITAVVAAAVALAAPARAPAAVVSALDGVPVEVRVQLEVTVMPGEASVPARLVAIADRTGTPYAVSVPVRLLGVDAAAREPLGTTLEATARLIALEPGDARLALIRPLGDWQPTRDPPPLLAFGDQLRERFLELMQNFGGDGAVLLPGLAIGDTSAVPDELDLAMKHSSLSHLTAVSGANCAIVVGLVLALGALLRWSRTVRIVAALGALAFFVVLVTPEPSVIRASVMATAVLIAVQTGRPAQGLPILALAVTSILIIDPWIARQYGFVLSVLATGALLVLAGPLAERLRAVMPAPVALWIAVPLAAQLACQPVLILLQPEIPMMGVVANILAAPAAPIATIVGMVACLLAPVVPWLATAVAAVAWLPSSWIAGVARVTAELPGALLPWPEGALGAALLAAVTLGLLAALGVPWAPGAPRGRRQVRLVACALIVVVMGATAGADAVRDRLRPGDWSIAQCDVGQGDAVLVRDSRRTALIDTGADPDALAACLDALGVAKLDVLVVTHFDLDHVGGVDAVVGRVGTVLTGPVGEPADQATLDRLAAAGAAVVDVRAGDTGMLGSGRWVAHWPPDHRGVEPGNAASLVIEVRPASDCTGCPSLLALGDVGEGEQRTILAGTTVPGLTLGAVDVVKVSHHGSADQHPELYERLDAVVALIGVGADNTYGHPASSIVDVLAGGGATVLRTDQHALGLVGGSDDGLWVWTERGAPEGVGARR